ncbi:MAG: DUF1992 domain-containing protein [Bacillota bacterium]
MNRYRTGTGVDGRMSASVPDRELEQTPAGRSFTHWMEEILARSMKEGEFDHLPGKGKPLKLGEADPYAGPEADAYRILKNAGFTPEWVELRRRIAAEINWLRANPKHPERISRIVEVNLLIEKHNRQIPSPSMAFPKVPRDFGQA